MLIEFGLKHKMVQLSSCQVQQMQQRPIWCVLNEHFRMVFPSGGSFGGSVVNKKQYQVLNCH